MIEGASGTSGLTLAGLVVKILGLFNLVIPTLVALALVFFMIGVVKYVRHAGKKDDRKVIMWSLIALFVLLSFWGILRIMINTFLGPTAVELMPEDI